MWSYNYLLIRLRTELSKLLLNLDTIQIKNYFRHFVNLFIVTNHDCACGRFFGYKLKPDLISLKENKGTRSVSLKC